MNRNGLSPTELQRLLDESTEDLQRVKAEYDNYRKRVHRDRMAVGEIAVVNVLRALLPVLDAVDRTCAQEPMTPGLRDIIDTLEAALGSLGLQSFGEEGDAFDPARHEALTHHTAPDAERLTCTEILRPGYRIRGRLLRPAQVAVTGPPPAAALAPGPTPAREKARSSPTKCARPKSQ
ncbi:nucleotide exchange factor GrpE [Streptomyces purpurogeneiscleroticus]|uniref:nucleotide exchange factor GrpE n=1 Tax=Streptomyces purpurogeneiscleroticus TaxID=68259 RepID=UPI001CC077EF|nr:nucleotide exchange factor GrpE [Streptomyces purpurogeneiscleroticus]MBZ4014949.1 nucleotide exchange factor GrpE [Streptomyces purpurogeneiscleroticus]